jgi:hypothetical protein
MHRNDRRGSMGMNDAHVAAIDRLADKPFVPMMMRHGTAGSLPFRALGHSTASMSGDHGVYALFMKMDGVKYGFSVRLGTHKTSCELRLRSKTRVLYSAGYLEQYCRRRG